MNTALSLLLFFNAANRAKLPEITLQALLQFGDRTNEGQLIRAVAVPWYEILALIQKDPQASYLLGARKWEEIIAGAYERAGFNVILTPASGDRGRDIIATKADMGSGSIRIFDQVKAYKPGHVVTAEEVRAMIGTLDGENVSKGIVTTTSMFAPRLMDNDNIRRLVPHRLDLRPGDLLFPWLDEVAKTQPSDA
jgi:restriction system protein